MVHNPPTGQEPAQPPIQRRSWWSGSKGKAGRHKGGVFGLAQWPDCWVLVQIEAQATGQLAVNICEIAPLEGDSAGRLQSVLRQKRITRCTGVATLTPSQYRTFLEESANAPAAELGSIMRWRVRDRIDFPVENAVVAVQPVPTRKRDDAAEKNMVNVFVANQEEVLRLSAMATRLQIHLLAVDAHESALRHIAALMGEGAAGEMVLLHVGPQDTQVMAIRDGEAVFSRRIKVGTERIGDHLRGETGGRDKALALGLEPLAVELQRTLEYIRTRMHMTVNKISLAPSENPISGLTAALDALLPGLTVTPLELAKVFHFPDGVPAEKNLALALPALGAAVGQLRKNGSPVNLLEERLRPKRDLLSGRPIMLFGLLSFIILGGVVGLLRWQAGKIRVEYANVFSQEATLKAEVMQLANNSADQALRVRLENELQQVAEKISLHQRLLLFLNGNKLGQQEGFSGYLEDLSRYTIPGIWLTQISFRDGGRDVGFSGKGTSSALVPAFVESMGRAKNFQNTKFDVLHITQEKKELEDWIHFSLRTKRMAEMKP
ncbi:MAG: hypothetical protein HQL63_09800 [Magnetococcales bacterium]|nr:hypothetical protein [Magnetococcales bacterium]MBF0321505.1 hypothetical protein [Magnetococcales bacterium]